MSRKPTARKSAARSPHRARTTASHPGSDLIVTTRKIAAGVSCATTGCGIADDTLRSLLGQSVRHPFILLLSSAKNKCPGRSWGETRTFCCQFDVVCDSRGNPVRWDSFAAQPWRLRRSTALFASRAKGASLRAYRARPLTLPASTALTPKLRESGCSCSRKYLPALSASSPFFQSASVPVWLQLIIGISLVQAAHSG